ALILESRSGTPPRNADYKPALTALLSRLALLNAVLLDAVVDSSMTQAGGLPASARRIVDVVPLALADVVDVLKLRQRMGPLQSKVARRPDAKGSGNSHRRIRLLLEVPGYGPGEAGMLEQQLALPVMPLLWPGQSAVERLAELSEQPPSEDGYTS